MNLWKQSVDRTPVLDMLDALGIPRDGVYEIQSTLKDITIRRRLREDGSLIIRGGNLVTVEETYRFRTPEDIPEGETLTDTN